jgi:hypothetical protein
MLVSNDMVCLLMQGGHKTQIAVGDYQSSSLTVGKCPTPKDLFYTILNFLGI